MRFKTLIDRMTRKTYQMSHHTALSKNRLEVELYSKEGCHLCEAARDVLKALCDQMHLHFIEYTLQDSDRKYEMYQYKFPIVVINGFECCYGRVDRARVFACIKLLMEK